MLLSDAGFHLAIPSDLRIVPSRFYDESRGMIRCL